MRIYLCRLFQRCMLLGLTASALCARPRLADAPEQSASAARVQPDANFGYGKQEWSIASGHGFGVGIFGSNNGNLKDIRFAALVPRWGIGLTETLAEGTWYEGNLDLLVEGASLFEYHPQHGFAGEGTLMLRYNLLQSGRAVPFIEAGAGILGTDLDLRGQSDGFNFTVQGGAGLHFFVLPRVAVTAEARLHHISNAGLRVPNSGTTTASSW